MNLFNKNNTMEVGKKKNSTFAQYLQSPWN